jgi:hypothetical protein
MIDERLFFAGQEDATESRDPGARRVLLAGATHEPGLTMLDPLLERLAEDGLAVELDVQGETRVLSRRDPVPTPTPAPMGPRRRTDRQY